MADGWRLAVGTLTAIPVSPPRQVSGSTARTAMLLAPVVAVLPAVAAAAVAWAGLRLGLGALAAATLSIVAVALSNRGLHLDGLADTADALATGYDSEVALAVMRRGDVGPAGAAALVLLLLGQVAAAGQLLTAGPATGWTGPALIGAGVVAGRTALPLACTRGIPAARPGGLGAMVAGSVPIAALAAELGVLFAAAALVGSACGLPWWQGVVALLAAVAATAGLLRRATRRFGGITGDVLGAGVEIATLVALLALSAGSS